MRARPALVLSTVALCVAACGGSPPTVAPAGSVAPPAPPVTVVDEPPPDVSPLPAPVGLGLTVHLAHPRATFQQLAPFLGPIASLLGPSTKVELEGLVTLAVGAPIGGIVDLDQPVDLAMSDVDSPGATTKMAGAVVLNETAPSHETLATLAKYYKLVPTARGVTRLEPRDDAPDDASPRPCMLTPASGADGAARGSRLVCGDTGDSVRHLGPYLARTMTRIASRDDLRVEVFVREFHSAKSHPDDVPAAGLTGATPDPKDPTDKLVSDLTDKLSDDVGSVILEASSDGTTLDVRLTTKFADAASPLTRALVGLGAPAASPPAAFERLPRDASSAWYGRGAAAAELAPLRSALFESLRTWLVDDGYAPRAVDTQMAPLERLALTGGPWVVASGLRIDAARTALDAYVDAGKTTEAARAKARAAMQGWIVGAVEEPSQAWIDGVRELVKNDAVKPGGKARRKREPNKETTRLSIAPVPAALQLPAGTLHVEGRVTQNPAWTLAQAKAKTKPRAADLVIPHTVHFFVVPDGAARTLFAAAEDAALAASEVRASLAGAGKAGTLETRRDLDALRAMNASTAGFVSVAGLATWLRTDWSDEGLRKARESLIGLAALTDGGAAPVPVSLAARPGEGGAGHGGDVRLRFVLPIKTGLEVAGSQHSIF